MFVVGRNLLLTTNFFDFFFLMWKVYLSFLFGETKKFWEEEERDLERKKVLRTREIWRKKEIWRTKEILRTKEIWRTRDVWRARDLGKREIVRGTQKN